MENLIKELNRQQAHTRAVATQALSVVKAVTVKGTLLCKPVKLH